MTAAVLAERFPGVAEGAFVPYGLVPATGRLVTVAEVARGRAADVSCPECGNPLLAKQGATIRWHFAHAVETACSGVGETMLHRLGKQVIQTAKTVHLPDFMARSQHYRSKVWERGYRAYFDRVEIEAPFGPYRIDAMGYAGAHRFAVEIVVSHKCSPEKVAAFRDGKLDAFEIDLSGLRHIKPGEIDQWILNEAPRHWVYSREEDKAAEAWHAEIEEAKQRLERATAARMAEWREAQDRERVRRERERASNAARVANIGDPAPDPWQYGDEDAVTRWMKGAQ